MPNKLYEYIASDKPIVLIGPKDGDAALKSISAKTCSNR